jgi:hypothetical protein
MAPHLLFYSSAMTVINNKDVQHKLVYKVRWVACGSDMP